MTTDELYGIDEQVWKEIQNIKREREQETNADLAQKRANGEFALAVPGKGKSKRARLAAFGAGPKLIDGGGETIVVDPDAAPRRRKLP